MVKDTLREIKKRKLQFFAILLITALGVGFFIGIRVTGYDMRETANLYMENSNVLDLQIMSSFGIDEQMLTDFDTLLNSEASRVYSSTVYANNDKFDGVISLYELNDSVIDELTVEEGKLPEDANEAFIDSLLASLYDLAIGDEIHVKGDDIFSPTTLNIVGVGKSSLYLNKSRGYTNLGSGDINGYVYAVGLQLKNDVIPSIRYTFEAGTDIDEMISLVERNQEVILQDRFDRLIQPERDRLIAAEAELAANRAMFEAEMLKQEAIIKNSEIQLEKAHKQLSDGLNELTLDIPTSGTLDERLALVQGSFDVIRGFTEDSIKSLKQRINEVESEIIKVELQKQLLEQEAELAKITKQYRDGIVQLTAGIKQYNAGVIELEQGKQRLASERTKALAEFAKYEAEIKLGFKKIEQAPIGDLYILERKDVIIGYTDFYNDSERIEAIGSIFPLIFFGVAILITLSTMSQMVDESRSQLGVYKALGYSSLQASMKYVTFAFIAWFIGMVIGIIMGFYILPTIIYNAYRIMYETPELESAIVLSYLWLPLIVSFLASVGVAFVKSLRVSNEYAANLLRPALPKSGQRILLERWPSLWNRFSFLYKVSIRNLFRNKVRFLMTIIGIAGCTGLLITGFGISYSINSIMDIQFDDIFIYDGMISYTNNENLDASLYDSYIDVFSENVKVDNTPTTLYVVEDIRDFKNYFAFNSITKEEIKVSNNEVILTEKLAEIHNVTINDQVNVSINNVNYSFTVTNIIQNFAGHYMIIDEAVYRNTTNTVVENNVRFFLGDELSKEQISEIMLDDEVLNVTLTSSLIDVLKEQMGNFDVIILVVIAAAVLLEVIVLTNLISMNISERKKELATLKVLGFYPNELSTYILRENIIMTILSLFGGVLFGIVLHLFVVKTAEIDMVMFNRHLNISSIIYSVVFTLLVSIVINLFMSRRADRVNMNEALKTFDA